MINMIEYIEYIEYLSKLNFKKKGFKSDLLKIKEEFNVKNFSDIIEYRERYIKYIYEQCKEYTTDKVLSYINFIRKNKLDKI